MSKKETKREWKVPAETEFRFEVDWDQKVAISLKEGSAEIYGTEIGKEEPYEFIGGSKLAIYSWQGCVIEINGPCKFEGLSKSTNMNALLNTHLALETVRQKVQKTENIGPKVIIIGDIDSGKTTLARTLVSYACRGGKQALFVDLDPNDGTLVIPTTIGAVVVDRLDVEERNGFNLTTAPPLLYSFGYHLPTSNIKAYMKITERLADNVQQKMIKDSFGILFIGKVNCTVGESGCVIDTHPWIGNEGHDLLLHQIDAFKVEYAIVVGQDENLYNEIKQNLMQKRPSVKIVYIPKSEGVVPRDKNYRKRMRMQRIKEYFYGTPRNELSPFSTTVSFGEVAVRRIKEDKNSVDENQLLKVESGPVLLHTILALSNAELPFNAGEKDEEKLIETNIAGFVYVSEVDENKKRIYMLCPNPGTLIWTDHH